MSGVPQGSVLRHLLFLIYINDLDYNITSNVLKFVDDTKVLKRLKMMVINNIYKNYLDKLVNWSEKWQMLFNFWKCKYLHTGHGNLDVNYKMRNTVLGTGLIRRNITYKEKELITHLYKAIVRPHLEYCIQAWTPYHKKDIDTLERIQRRATGEESNLVMKNT